MTESHRAALHRGSAPRHLASTLFALVSTVVLFLGTALTAPAAGAAPRR
ncbi:hypothetical protein [Streptomyces alanosinicus]|uniref:Uncharacterized protein n=1 Tax=Streptomyces alanosinicus TaxID=68171 RepID=A0A918YMS6_9ACTN|nr:hypothetical protein [Streptomyces alanosinicus]GHE09011.1 hypothetical protein GCM10010339_59890 [Streptomyces alanosinicus]